MICGYGFVLWCSMGLFYGGCGFVGGGCAVLALDCVFFFFWFSYRGLWLWLVGRRWGGCLWLRRSGFWVSGWRRGFVAWVFFFFFLVLTVDYGLLVVVVVVVVSGVCSAAVVVIVVVE